METGDEIQARRPDEPGAWTWIGLGLAAAVFLGAWATTWGASFTHDEAVYVDIAEHPLRSDYYPGEIFLRHPPLGLGLMAGWESLDLPWRAWPVPWVLGGLGLLGAALVRRGGGAWPLAGVTLSPALLPLVSVTMYPPLFFGLSLTAWGWASQRRGVEIVGWNLAVLTHELALLVLAFRLAPRAVAYIRERESRVSRWASLVLPYPAALAWGAWMIAGLVQGGDPRGGVVSGIVDPSANALAVLGLKPLVGLVFAAVLVPLARWPSEPDHPARGLAVASGVAIVAAPFYRYLLALVPLLVVVSAPEPSRWIPRDRRGPAIALGALLATGGAGGLMFTGTDTLNAADVPGLVDHDEAATLLEANETVVVRSPPSFAHVLRDQGFELVRTGTDAPSRVELSRGGTWLVLLRAETSARGLGLEADAAVLPQAWDRWTSSLTAEGWDRTATAGGMVRLEAPQAAPSPEAG